MTAANRFFASDNYSSVHPDVMYFLQHINTNHMPSYGEDEITAQAKELCKTMFDAKEVLFTTSGTAANILGMQLLLGHSYDAVLCSDISHVYQDEVGALSAHAGAQIFPLSQVHGKISLESAEQEVAKRHHLGFHSSKPKVLSIASPTECGTYYTVSEIQQLAAFCHQNDMYLHVDGCRLSNVADTHVSNGLQHYIKDAGVDILTFGGAKNGLLNAEAVVIFNAPTVNFLRLQKQSLQLQSKMRYLAGQFVPYLQNNVWLRNARHANRVANYLYTALSETLGQAITLTHPLETNQLFCTLPSKVISTLRQAGYKFYDINNANEVRFVASWDNTYDDVDAMLSLL